jgi:hypothetical protein
MLPVSIRFETTIDHLIAFNRFHYENSPVWRKQCLIRALLVPSMLAVLFLAALLLRERRPFDDPMPDAVRFFFIAWVLIGLSVASYFFVRRRMMANLVTTVRNLLAEGSNRSVLGWCEMELADNWLVVNRDLIQSRFHLQAVEKIIARDDFTFVNISSVNAIRCGSFPRTNIMGRPRPERAIRLVKSLPNRPFRAKFP